MGELLKIISTIALSGVKHTFGGVPLAVGYGFSYFEIALYCAIGGIIGSIAFMFFQQGIELTWRRIFPKKAKQKTFTWRNKLVVRVKQRFGLVGIAFITPPLLSIPVGTFIASSIWKNKTQVLVALVASVIFWSFTGAAVAGKIVQVATNLP